MIQITMYCFRSIMHSGLMYIKMGAIREATMAKVSDDTEVGGEAGA